MIVTLTTKLTECKMSSSVSTWTTTSPRRAALSRIAKIVEVLRLVFTVMTRWSTGVVVRSMDTSSTVLAFFSSEPISKVKQKIDTYSFGYGT